MIPSNQDPNTVVADVAKQASALAHDIGHARAVLNAEAKKQREALENRFDNVQKLESSLEAIEHDLAPLQIALAVEELAALEELGKDS